jgi:hypothetical protein
MKVQIVSDLHLEFPYSDISIPNMGSDLLVLGGDICTAHNFSPRIRAFFEDHCSRFPYVVYLMGNHEHYHGDVNETAPVLDNGLGDILNLRFLEGDSFMAHGVPVFGGTLWTDCNKADPGTLGELYRGLNDYRLVTCDGERMDPVDTMAFHRGTVEEIVKFCELNKYKPSVIICTHHSPSLKSIAKKYGNDFRINGGYHSDLEWIMEKYPNIKLWTHGHTHTSWDYMVGNTRVVCNPAGYPVNKRGGRENPEFDPCKMIELADSPEQD